MTDNISPGHRPWDTNLSQRRNRRRAPQPRHPQTVAPGETMAKLLPSFLVSAEAERTGGAAALPLVGIAEEVIGTYARKQVQLHPADSSPQPELALVQWRRPTL